MEKYISKRLGQDLLAVVMLALLAVAVLGTLVQQGSLDLVMTAALVFLLPSLASAANHLYRDVRRDVFHA
ncbi:MAG: hypothetical protein P1U64_03780 [Alcanivoracaceae bacterium]|mgnify:CR=1 FL=1|jgi:hypothetical protein|nr:hypothetical protein [Alcanivoracaceae bacterium]